MAKHTSLGRVCVTVGQYQGQGDQTKRRYREIGELMETTEDDGAKRHWLSLNADIFHAALFSLASITRTKGEDRVSCAVFPRDRDDAPKKSTEPTDDDGPF